MGPKNLTFIILSLAVLIIVTSCNPGSEDTGVQWVFVSGGTFEQGENQFIISPKGDTVLGFTSPSRMVEISDFYLSKYEITVGQFRAFCEATNREMPPLPKEDAFGRPFKQELLNNHPMLATWNEANDYAKWVGGRLPTEAEWEYAAKGGSKSKGFRYSGSDNPIEIGWVRENSDSSFHVVGQLKPNELGLYDMTGNVSEWVSDWYDPDLDYSVDLKDPQGPKTGDDKISKGISWYYAGLDSIGNPLKYGIHMPEVRYQSPPDTRNDGFGFRIARDP